METPRPDLGQIGPIEPQRTDGVAEGDVEIASSRAFYPSGSPEAFMRDQNIRGILAFLSEGESDGLSKEKRNEIATDLRGMNGHDFAIAIAMLGLY